MNTYEKIINNSKKGLFTVIENDGEFKIVAPIKDGGDELLATYWQDSIEKCKEEGFGNYVFDEGRTENSKIVDPYHLPVEPFKDGDKVRILDSIMETDGWENHKYAYPDMTGEITDIYNGTDGLHYEVNNNWYISHQHLAPLYDDDENEDKTEEAIQLLKDKGYKIIKK